MTTETLNHDSLIDLPLKDFLTMYENNDTIELSNMCDKCAYNYNNNCDINATPIMATEINNASIVIDCPCFISKEEYFKKWNNWKEKHW